MSHILPGSRGASALLCFLTSALPVSLVGACADHDAQPSSPPSFDADPAKLRAALEEPIADCQEEARACTEAAEDIDGRIACNDALAGCLQHAASRAQSMSDRVLACRADARVCVRNGGDVASCREGFEACADSALSGGEEWEADAGSVPARDAGATGPQRDAGSPQEGDGGPQGGQLGSPSLPASEVDGGAAGSGSMDALPEPFQCALELRLCLMLDITSPSLCAQTARVCLQFP